MSKTRVRVFVDYWNFQLSLNSEIGGGDPDYRFEIDWVKLGPWLAGRACEAANIADGSFEGAIIYTSHDPRTEGGKKFHKWATTWLARQPGLRVECRERKAKKPPKCPKCHKPIETCPHCAGTMWGSQEKGVDTLIATDMIRLAWEGAYEVAVLATSDRDLVPAVEFLNLKGAKVIHAAFPPLGSDLSGQCWASFPIPEGCETIRRAKK